MTETAKNEILNINKVFYQSIAKDFSRTRQLPWKGWDLITKYIPQRSSIKILDVACGNARFYDFLRKKYNNKLEYTGIDITDELLDEARQKYPEIKLLKYDVISDMKFFNHKYDLIVAFGIAHHIPDEKLRNEWFISLAELLNDKGVLIVTLWDYIKTISNDVKNRIVETEKIPVAKTELDEGDYFLWWGSDKNNIRYCHDYSNTELNNIKSILKTKNIKTTEIFKADGKLSNLNTYLVFTKE